MGDYRSRIADAELQACLGSGGAVVIEGPKACGKTRMAQQVSGSSVLLDVNAAARQAWAVDPALVLAGDPGPFILTGSAVPADDAARHTGGRALRLCAPAPDDPDGKRGVTAECLACSLVLRGSSALGRSRSVPCRSCRVGGGRESGGWASCRHWLLMLAGLRDLSIREQSAITCRCLSV